MKNFWKKLIRRNLPKHPAHHSKDILYKQEHKCKFIIPKNIGLSVKTHKNNNLSSEEHVRTPFLKITKTGLEVDDIPSKPKYEIPWSKIVEMRFKFTKD